MQNMVGIEPNIVHI